MLRKTIKWTDPFTNEERSREMYFHVGMGDMSRLELQYGFQGGMEGVAKAIVEAKDAPAIISLFEKIIAMSYGRRMDDGDFVKKLSWTEEFVGGRAYDALFFELTTDAEAGAEFINGIMPDEVKKKVRELQNKSKDDTPVTTVSVPFIEEVKEEVKETDEKPFDPFAKHISEYSASELMEMPYPHFDRLMRTHAGQLPRSVVNIRFQRDLAEENKNKQ